MSSDRNESAKGNILIVDNMPENIRLLSTMLQQAGYEIRAIEGKVPILNQIIGMILDMAKNISFDTVLIDIDGVGTNSHEICTQLKAIPETKDIPVIFLSSLDDLANKLRGFEVGGADYITKPFQPPELLARVKNQAQQRQLRKQLEEQNKLLQTEIINHLATEEALQKTNYELELLNKIDSLTMLSNRSYFNNHLEGNWRQMQRETTFISVIICDIDLLHLYNKVYGRKQGDNCLQVFAQAIGKTVKRPGDIASRYGEDEFSIVLPKTDASGAIAVAKHIQRELQTMAIVHSKSPTGYLTVSIGISTAEPTQQISPQILLETAEQALYQSKQEGRNSIIFKMVTSSESI